MRGSARWRLWLDLVPRRGALNMAIDQALLERAGRQGEHWLRLYRWDPPCLSFGRHERATARYDRARIAVMALDVVRRPTGGRAVWHAGELTYALAAPAAGLGGLRATYRETHAMLRAALQALGADAELAEDVAVPGLQAGACFAHAVGGEILVGGRKVAGSAQLRQGGAILQHGSILLTDDQEVVRRVTLGEPPPDGSAPLERLLGRSVPPTEVARAVAATAARRWGGDWTELEGPTGILMDAEEHLPHFVSDDWTWRA